MPLTAPSDARLRAMARQLRRALNSLGEFPEAAKILGHQARAVGKLDRPRLDHDVRERLWAIYAEGKPC